MAENRCYPQDVRGPCGLRGIGDLRLDEGGANRSLPEARARNVADALMAAGVAPGRARVQPRGPVPSDATPVEARRGCRRGAPDLSAAPGRPRRR